MMQRIINRDMVLVLDNLRSVQNVASLFRTADCFGISKIYLCGTTPAPIDRFGRERLDFAKISLGSEKSVDWEHRASTDDVVRELQGGGFWVIAVEQSENSSLLHEFVPATGLGYALILGAEVLGINPIVMNRADQVLEIRQFGKKESLNVSVAGAIAMYHLRFVGNASTM